jgi:hypothetical protein
MRERPQTLLPADALSRYRTSATRHHPPQRPGTPSRHAHPARRMR